ncbi:MAG: hypothetical protein WBO54_05105, partial [Thermoanaerobaculia bacterium]
MKHANQNMLVWCLALLLCSATPALGAHGGPGLHETILFAGQTIDAGSVSIWNSPKNMMVQVNTEGGWRISEVHIYVGYPEIDPIPTTKKGNIKIGHLPYKQEYWNPVTTHMLTLDLQDDLGFSWGSQYRELRQPTLLVHASLVRLDEYGQVVAEEGAWAYGTPLDANHWGWYLTYLLAHPRRGQFIDSPVQGLYYVGPTQEGVIGFDEEGAVDEQGGFSFFPGESVDFSVGWVPLGTASAAKKVSPLDLFSGVSVEEYPVLGVARTLQSLDNDQSDGKIVIAPEVAECFSDLVYDRFGSYEVVWEDPYEVDELLDLAVGGVYEDSDPSAGACDFITHDNEGGSADLRAVSDAEAAANLEAGLNASGIFRKNLSKTEDWAETKQKLDVMPVYIPALRSDGEPSTCCLDDKSTEEDECADTTLWDPGVGYFEWRLNADPEAEECDPREYEDGSCVTTLIECREVAKPIVVTYMEKIDLSEATTEFNECGAEPTLGCRFSYDIVTAVSRDDGNTWKRMNVSRMADLSSFELETGEAFPGTVGSPYLKINDNYILNVWQSKFCKSGNPRYSINVCPDEDGDGTPDDCLICRGNPDQGTEICEPDYPGDDPYYVTDIWG